MCAATLSGGGVGLVQDKARRAVTPPPPRPPPPRPTAPLDPGTLPHPLSPLSLRRWTRKPGFSLRVHRLVGLGFGKPPPPPENRPKAGAMGS
jgi:hypothetical protein